MTPHEGTAGHAGGRIGPNAITQVVAVVTERHGVAAAGTVLLEAGLGRYRDALPGALVPETEVMRLHVALARRLGPGEAASVAREAGLRTADYILANRIPAPARRLLSWLPAPIAGRLLLAAIRRHAWTFAGTARFEGEAAGRGVRVRLAGCRLCRTQLAGGRPDAFYAATFEGLFRHLVHARSRATTAAQGWPVAWEARIGWRRAPLSS